MGLKYTDFDTEYNRVDKKILLNDINFDKGDAVADINRLLYTVYNTTIIDTTPKCGCGAIHSSCRIGVFCHDCGTYCEEPNKNKDPLLWVGSINNIPFITPIFWGMLRRILDSKVDCLRWLSDSSYNPQKKPDFLPHMLTVIGGVRSYENLYKNIPKLIDYAKQIGKFKKDVDIVNQLDKLKFIWRNVKETRINYFSIPNKNLFVMESNSKGRFINLAVTDMVDVVNYWIKKSSDELDNHSAGKATAKLLSSYCDFSSQVFDNFMAGKKKIVRKHVYGSRANLAHRNTIVCVPKVHDYEIIEIPWNIGLTTYRPLVLNKLIRRGFKYKQASKMIIMSVDRYNPIIHEILEELVRESPEKGLPTIAQRNPTLLQGSIQKVFATFKTDPLDNTVSISKLIVSNGNGDYDGDQLNFTPCWDKLLADEFEPYAPHYNMTTINSPYDISGTVNMQGPANLVLSEYLKCDDDIPGNTDDL